MTNKNGSKKASDAAKKAWKTRRRLAKEANASKEAEDKEAKGALRSAAANKAWVTRRRKAAAKKAVVTKKDRAEARSAAARKAWKTRRKKNGGRRHYRSRG